MEQEQAGSKHRSTSPSAATAIKMTKLFAESYIEAFNKISKSDRKFTVSSSYYVINAAQTRHRVASLLDFTGGINGFAIINYPKEAALDVVEAFLTGMGMGKEDCPKAISEEAINTIGEVCNQVLGGFRRNVEQKYGFHATSGTPITMLVNTQLIITPVDADKEYHYIRAQVTTPSMHPFFLEFCLEEGTFVKLK